ncbi:unnamed protein product [Enterobius vermicularis]|uniref:RPOL4c domain-containing protein n=1 Tax=Enterobius vermicularis TaxID=51028 RepID=A0A0N4V2K3_ENTVE|nr:unnamed protein product [Enterobius vermicularis]
MLQAPEESKTERLTKYTAAGVGAGCTLLALLGMIWNSMRGNNTKVQKFMSSCARVYSQNSVYVVKIVLIKNSENYALPGIRRTPVMPGNQTDDAVDEDATELKFPKEFEQADTLLTSEVFLLLEHRRQQSEQKEEIDEMSDVFVKTLNYSRRMARYKSRETIRAVRTLLANKPLHKFEVAQIANLCPESAEEAKALIPSLENKMEDDELDELLKDLHSKKTFQ